MNSFRRPRSNNTLNAALRRLGGEERKVPGGCLGTLLNETGALESGHDRATAGPHRVDRAYMHAAEFWSERVEMMQVWADHLDQLRYDATNPRIRPFALSQG